MAIMDKVLAFPRVLLAGDPSRTDVGLLVVGTLSAIGSGVPFPVIGILFGELLNDLNTADCDTSSSSETSTEGSIDSTILLIVYLAIAQFVLIYVHLLCWSLNGARLAQRLRELYLQNLLRQEPSYFDSLPSGEVASRFNGDIQAIRSGTAEKVGICLASISFFVTAYVVAFIKDAQLAAMLISLVPAYFIMSFVGSHYIEKYAGRMSDYSATAASLASEALSNVTVVLAFGANSRLEKRFTETLESSKIEGVKKATAIGIQSGVLYFVAYSANALAFWQGSRQVANGVSGGSSDVSVGAVFTVIFVLVEATLLLSQVAPFVHLFIGAVAAYNKLRPDLDRETQIDGSGSSGLHISSSEGGFELENISFTYPSRREVTVLDGISLSIPAHKHTAIVGLSGSGKSTIAGLLTRLYHPNQGRVLYDGRDVSDLNVRDMRSFLSLVQQEPSLLDRSILENIAHGLLNSGSEHEHLKVVMLGSDLADLAEEVRDGADLQVAAKKRGEVVSEIVELVQKAAVLADADSFITKLQHGYGTLVGASGRLISGGQKQRISLARALVKDPKVLILDEATASLDSSSERRIQNAINRIADGRTMVTIAHRLSTITAADNIIVMHRGRILEQGPHTTLMANNGTYAEMVKLQTLSSVSNNDGPVARGDEIVQPSAVGPGSDVDDDYDSKDVSLDEKHGVASAEAVDGESTEEADEPETPAKSLWALTKGYSPAFRPHTLTILVALIGSFIVGAAFSGEAIIFGNTVSSLSLCNTAAYILKSGKFYGLMFFVLAIIEFFANLVSWTGFGCVSEKSVYTVRVLSFRSLFEQDLQWHQSNGRNPAQLLSYITRDGDALAGLSGSVVGTLFSISVNLVGSIILTHIIAWRIALVCLSLLPLLLGAGLMELHVLAKFEEKHETAYTKSVDIGVEAVTSIKTVASLCIEDEVLHTYQRALDGPRKETLRVTLQASFCQALLYFFGNCINALAYWWGSKQIVDGNYTQTQFLIVVFSLLVGALLWSQMFALAPELTNARASMARLLGLIEIGSTKLQAGVQPLITDVEATAETKLAHTSADNGASVDLRDVHFCYPARPDIKVLNGLDMKIPPGKFCALVGPSGAGKSTIISLVERLYSPQSGAIVIDGVDVTKHRGNAFRDNLALVPQESVLFEGSVEFNIGLGARPGEEVSLDDIKEACKLANIHDTIEALPDGYQTLCGPNGSQFSGGQKQRLSIARALVRKPKLLILDESTSALDAESERLLQEGLDKAARGITVIAIAHRLHTIRKADIIFLIDGGKCTDHGSHDELLERSESYRSNVLHQTVAV